MFLKKTLILFLSLWCIITLTFFLMHIIPGDPFIGEQNVPTEVLHALHSHYDLDQPLYIQYCKYIKNLLQGNLGYSIIYHGRSVNQCIVDGFPISAALGIQALIIAIPLGVMLGTWAALHKNKWQDTTAMILSTIGTSIPSFVLSSLLQFIFCIQFHLLPVARWGNFEHTILPSIALAALPTAFIARLVRSNLIEVLEQDYIRTALAKGLPWFLTALKHGLKNAILPVIGYLGPLTSNILTGSFLIERIFAIPGLGQWMIHSIYGRDYPMIIGLTIFFSTFLILSMFMVDLVYTWIDPRLREQKASKKTVECIK